MSEHIDGVLEHKKQVARYMLLVASDLMRRAVCHDDSKFSPEEMDTFERMTPILKTLTYGTDEYKDALKELGPALQHHYQHNDHHPEYFRLGIEGMALIEVVEMVCDWMAAVQRVKNGTIYESLDINRDRFKIDAQLFAIITNTVSHLTSLDEPY